MSKKTKGKALCYDCMLKVPRKYMGRHRAWHLSLLKPWPPTPAGPGLAQDQQIKVTWTPDWWATNRTYNGYWLGLGSADAEDAEDECS